MIFMKLLFMIKKAFVQSARLKHPKFVRGAVHVTLAIMKLRKKIIDLK